MSVPRKAIVAEARTWLGVPWRHQGWRKETGCDCVGLVRGVGHALIDASDENPANARFIGYAREPDPALMRAALDLHLVALDRGAAEPGDVLWLRFAGEPRHLAILAGNEYVIHALESVGKVVEHRLDTRWAQRCIAAWRFPGTLGLSTPRSQNTEPEG
jgi:NlpC/P60 family putative phage cell wall peptidase